MSLCMTKRIITNTIIMAKSIVMTMNTITMVKSTIMTMIMTITAKRINTIINTIMNIMAKNITIIRVWAKSNI